MNSVLAVPALMDAAGYAASMNVLERSEPDEGGPPEPATILAVSMVSLLALGFCAQLMQQRGGAIARAAPFIILTLLVIISVAGMITLQVGLSSAFEWQKAPATAYQSRR